MSYILDALTKAAQQRDRQAPVVQRLLSPASRPRSPWSPTSGRLLAAALAVNAVVLAGVLSWWLWPVPVAAPPESAAVSAPTVESPRESPRPLIKLEPLPSPETKVEKPAAPTPERSAETPAIASRPSPPPPATPAPAPIPAPRAAPASPPAPSSGPRSGTPTLQLAPAPATPPAAAARPALPQEAAGLRLEALIYADVPTERMVFINGRRYREGDSIDGRLRIEEIREDGVELSDQGRRFTLRVAR
jgi:general secretion pathway protein B